MSSDRTSHNEHKHCCSTTRGGRRDTKRKFLYGAEVTLRKCVRGRVKDEERRKEGNPPDVKDQEK